MSAQWLGHIGLTLRHADKIKRIEAKRRVEQPWLFAYHASWRNLMYRKILRSAG